MDFINEIVWYLFIFVVIIFCIFGFEALFVDIYYLIYSIFRHFKTKKYPPLSYERLAQNPEQKIAIIVACWQEANVIGDMLRHNVRAIDYKNYTIYVGVYPNDPETTMVVESVAENFPHVKCVVQKMPGPTTKADNLNSIYTALLEEEANSGVPFDIIVLHDSEDMIHPFSLKLFNHLVPAKDMVQIPVFPLTTNYLNFTHWLYNDEFSEHHLKNLVVRESIGGLVPSAGVGTAFSPRAMKVLIEHNTGPSGNFVSTPFDSRNLTEDYHSALLLKLSGLQVIFAIQWVWRTVKRPGFFAKEKIIREYVATRAHFPTEYIKAVRQKARWIIGITLQEWAQTGWKGSIPVLYTLFQDRRSLLTLFAAGLAYVILIYWLWYSWWQSYNPLHPTVADILHRWPTVYDLIYISTVLMIERLLQRMYACWKIYGVLPALLSIPRAIYGNILNLHATLRAYRQYFFKPKKRRALKWDKTEHIFAAKSGLQLPDKKIGEYLIERGYLNDQQLVAVLNEHNKTGKRISTILAEKNLMNQKEFLHILAEQYGLECLDSMPASLAQADLPNISKREYKWLIRNRVVPVKFVAEGVLLVAIVDPADALLIDKIHKIFKQYKIQYVVYQS